MREALQTKQDWGLPHLSLSVLFSLLAYTSRRIGEAEAYFTQKELTHSVMPPNQVEAQEGSWKDLGQSLCLL